MGVNKNLLNFSGLIKPTSLLQSSRCFRQKISYFFTSECCVSVHPDKNSFSQADFRASRSCVCSCIWQPLAILKHPFRAAKTPNRDGKARCGLIPSMRLIPPGTLRHCKTAYPSEQRMSKGKPATWSKGEPKQPPPPRSTGEAPKNPEKGTRQALHRQLLPPLVLPSGAQGQSYKFSTVFLISAFFNRHITHSISCRPASARRAALSAIS